MHGGNDFFIVFILLQKHDDLPKVPLTIGSWPQIMYSLLTLQKLLVKGEYLSEACRFDIFHCIGSLILWSVHIDPSLLVASSVMGSIHNLPV